jgi:hypothetical protein
LIRCQIAEQDDLRFFGRFEPSLPAKHHQQNLVYSKFIIMVIKFSARLPILLLLFDANVVLAQSLDTVGSRASAMAAFVAVADDASAVVWNPAGLVTGPIFNLLIDVARGTHTPEEPPSLGTAGQKGTTIVALGTMPVGLTYYRLSSTAATLATPAAAPGPDRQDQQVVVRTLVTSHLGATVQQSLGQHFTVGTTVKLVRGEMGEQRRLVTTWEEALDGSGAIERDGSTRGDLDIGAMAYAGRFRLGVVVRNVTEPIFGSEDDPMAQTLTRHARVGVAWGNRWSGISSTIVAFDADVTDVVAIDGERRDVAAGVEHWFGPRTVGVRGGVRGSTIGDLRAVASGGASLALRPGTYVDAYFARGRAETSAWGIAARLTY